MPSRTALTFVMLASALLAACDGGKPLPDAPVVVDSNIDSSSTCGGTVAYLETCTVDDNCVSCVCRNFGHSTICTKACTGPADCPAPSGGCTNGFCRP